MTYREALAACNAEYAAAFRQADGKLRPIEETIILERLALRLKNATPDNPAAPPPRTGGWPFKRGA